ncbi:MAG: amidophosphoribosyltransferase [Christensenellaceae bacterium]|nr:amidophosphoribosyltransferase [Christensenellaceae bacterium]
MAKIHDECGVFGMYSPDGRDVVGASYYALYALQHRGQESCGIALNDRGVITCHKDAGLVSEVMTEGALRGMGLGTMVVGHVRYATTGADARKNAQPLVVNHVKGQMALAHNGALSNAAQLREALELRGSIFHTSSDTEVISYVITQARLEAPSIEEAIAAAMGRLAGAYSLVVMSPTKLMAVRDPHGFRPLCIGRLGESTVFASESCALDAIGARFVRDVEPGEIVVVDKSGMHSLTAHMHSAPKTTCVFESSYFARPDSVIDRSSVHTARLRAGAVLALEHPVQADVVVGVPDSGIDAAVGYARQSGIPYGIGFIKNKYVARTFIEPCQADRENKVRIKLNPVAATVAGKRVVLVDDSIVRGTTSARIVGLLRDAGAVEVHMRVSAPPFLHPCYFGTDIDSRDKLIACRYSVDEIRAILGADSLGYLSVNSVNLLADNTQGFCNACFTGDYPCEPPLTPSKSRFDVKLPEDAL